ncbi:MAG: DnaA ATPase domain-containing protein, partial [Bacteroidota bacterium]
MELYNADISTEIVPSNAQHVWDECMKRVRDQISSLSYKTWFQPIVPLKLEKYELTVQVPSQFFYDWLEEHYNSLIRDTITGILGPQAKLFYSIAVEDPSDALTAVESSVLPVPSGPENASPQQVYTSFSFNAPLRMPDNIMPAKSNLNSRYTFDNFIKGDSNQLARAAAMAVANNPGGTSFNPLVIYGGTGLGKTHLMHALGNQAIASGKAKRVVYVSSEKFTVD